MNFLDPGDEDNFEIQISQGPDNGYSARVTHRTSGAVGTSNFYASQEEALEEAFMRLEQLFSSGWSG